MINIIRTIVLFSLTVFAVVLLFTLNVLLFISSNWLTISLNDYVYVITVIILIVTVGALASILLSKSIVRIFLNVRIMDSPETANELRLFSTVKRLSDAVGIKMPQIVIYNGHDINAFATGFRRDSALLAVSQQLLSVMTQDEMEGVVGHEISHIENGDMLTLALMQGVVNCIVYLPANSIRFGIEKIFSRRRTYYIVIYYFIVTLTQLSFGWIASLLVMWFSRQREFHADLCGAKIAGYECMLRALECLQACKDNTVSQSLILNYDNLFRSSFYQLFISHPSLSARITALRNLS